MRRVDPLSRRERRRTWITRLTIFGILLAIFAFWSWMVPDGATTVAGAVTGVAADVPESLAVEAGKKFVWLMTKISGMAAFALVATALGRR